ncbi:MAG: hypothetical protein C0602_06200 [Denitrovibrio sp.]|nr:MAG: hypothetical protein C0602_06200 [Denitrovibrio sp.]
MNNNIVFNDAFFKFHPVGQGLFYSGRIHDFMLNEYEYENYFEKYLDTHIRDNYFHRNYRMFKHHFYSKAMGKNNVFDFIYDIGSDNKEIIQQVRDYVRFLDRSNKTKIDLLVLYHLDRDHVNGLKELNTINKERLSEGKQIIRLGTVVLPLLHEDEKFYLVSKQLIGDSTKDEPEKWYYELLNDTSSFFSNFGDPTLVFFNGNGPINDDIHPNDNLTNNVSEQINHYYKSDSITKDTFLTNKTPIKVYQWEFIFYDIRDKIPSDDLINFKKEVNKLVQENIDSDSLDNLLTESPEILEGLKKLYKGLKYTYN